MLRETLMLALREIRRNVMRSILTILGIVIGVAAVIALVTLGKGATAQVAAEIGSLGSNLLQVRAGQGFRGPGGVSSAARPFKAEDALAIAQQVSGVAAVAPNAQRNGQVVVGNSNWSTTVTGSSNDFLPVRNWTLASGRAFTDSELRAGRAVCILGATVAKELFGGRQTARTIHFFCMAALVLFFVIHIVMVLAAGPLNELRSIITGRYRTDGTEGDRR